MKKSTYDTILAIFCMLTPVSPGVFAKELVIVSTTLLILRILVTRNIFYFIKKKVLIILLFTPGIIFAIFTSSENLVRFVPVLLLVLGFPFYGFKIKAKPIMILAISILVYFIATQTLLAFGNSILLNFREVWYPTEFDGAFNYGTVNTLFFTSEEFRAGGLYYNPNVMATIILLYYLIFSVSFQYISENSINFSKKKPFIKNILYLIILSFVSVSLFFTISRTAIITLIVYIASQNFNMNLLKRGLIQKKFFWAFLFTSIFLLFVGERMIDGVVSTGGSANAKFQILTSYLADVNFLTLILGGTFNIHFDNEYGNWIGASGLLGIFAWINIFKMMYHKIFQTRALIIAFLFMAVGNTLFYGLLSGSIVLILFCITCSFWVLNHEEEKNKKFLNDN